MEFEKFDVFIIGSGTAGKIVAKDCAAEGLKVAITDNREFGGTCATRGCDPKKVMVGLTEILESAKRMKGKGIDSVPKGDWKDLLAFKETFVGLVPAATEKFLKEQGIKIFHQSPKFLDEHRLSVEGKTVKSRKTVIATGQIPADLKIPGWKYALISDDFLNLKMLPESMIFIGAGYIGMEFAHIAARFGVKVTVMEFAPRPLMNYDENMVEYLQQASEELGIEFILNAEVSGIEKLQNRFRVKADQNGKEISAEAELVFNTAGRVPSIADLDLEKGKVAFSKKGISVNDFLQNPTNKNVYACGDVADTEGLPLTPLSVREAKIVSANILDEKEPKKADYPPQTSVVFTLPNLASVGLSENEAKEKKLDFTVETELVPNWFNAKRTNENFYAYKVLVDNKTGYVIGAHLLSREASEVINLFALAIYGNISAIDLKKMVFTYPTWGNDIKSML